MCVCVHLAEQRALAFVGGGTTIHIYETVFASARIWSMFAYKQ